MLARLATRKAKPNGSYYVGQDQDKFMAEINVRHLPGKLSLFIFFSSITRSMGHIAIQVGSVCHALRPSSPFYFVRRWEKPGVSSGKSERPNLHRLASHSVEHSSEGIRSENR